MRGKENTDRWWWCGDVIYIYIYIYIHVYINLDICICNEKKDWAGGYCVYPCIYVCIYCNKKTNWAGGDWVVEVLVCSDANDVWTHLYT